MKRIITLLILLASFASAEAQARYTYRQNNYSARASRPHRGSFNDYFGLRIGMSLSSLRTSGLSDYMPGLEGQSGISVGGVYGISISDDAPAFFEVGLQYTEKGAKSRTWVVDPQHGTTENKYTYKYNMNYLEMPFVFKYKHAIDDDLSVEPFLGGYVALGVAGKSYYDRSFSKKHFNTFDGGVRLGCGLSFTRVYLGLSYDIGLSNVSQLGEYNSYAKNNCWELSVGLDF